MGICHGGKFGYCKSHSKAYDSGDNDCGAEGVGKSDSGDAGDDTAAAGSGGQRGRHGNGAEGDCTTAGGSAGQAGGGTTA